MLKSFFTTALMLYAMFGVTQQLQIKGKVLDAKNKQFLAGATIEVQGTRKFAITDEFGSFQLEKLEPGSYTLTTRFVGYASKTEPVTVSSNTELTILLEESVSMTDEVIVYATRANDKTPSSYTTIDQKTISKQNFGQDLPYLLNWSPSVVTTSDAGTGFGYTGVRIRGSDATSINVTINGIPYNDSESLGTFWVDIPDIASSSKSVQIQRGVGSSTNGAGAFGATINLQTNDRNEDPYVQIVNSVGFLGLFSDYNSRRHTLSFGTGLLNDHFILDGRISRIESSGYIDRASAELGSYYFSGGYYTGKTIIKALMFGGKERTYQAWYGVPESRLNNDVEKMYITAMNEGWNEEQTDNLLSSHSRTFNPYTYENQVDDYRQDHFQLHFSQQLTDALNANISLHYTPGKGYYEEYRYDDEFEDYGLDPVIIGTETVSGSDLIRRRWLDNDFYGFTYSLNYAKNRSEYTLGGGWNRYDGDHFGEIIWAEVSPSVHEFQYYFNNGDKRDFNIFLKATREVVDGLNVYLDLQARTISYKANGIENKGEETNISENFRFFNPKFGGVYALNDKHHVYASFNVGHREPVRSDFINAPLDNKPSAEVLYNTEAGYKYFGDNLMLNVNGFLMQYKNQLVHTGKVNDVGAPIRTNVDDSHRAGIELQGLVKMSSKLSLNANLTMSQNQIRNFEEVLYDYGPDFDEYNAVVREYKNTSISFSPELVAGAALMYRPVKGLEATWLYKFVSRQYLDNTENKARSLNPYGTNDVRLSYTIKPLFCDEISFSFLLNNVFDLEYESNGYTWGYLGGNAEYRENYYYPQAGRNIMGSITLKF